MTFLAASESDPGPYPFPLDLPLQPGEDHHGIVLEKAQRDTQRKRA